MRSSVGTDHRHLNFKPFLGWKVIFRGKLVKKYFLPKCVLTPKDHFERHLYFPHYRGGVKKVWKISTLFIFFFLKASLIGLVYGASIFLLR